MSKYLFGVVPHSNHNSSNNNSLQFSGVQLISSITTKMDDIQSNFSYRSSYYKYTIHCDMHYPVRGDTPTKHVYVVHSNGIFFVFK